MLATLIKEPFNDARYLYEIKWDGYRIIAHAEKEKIKLQSRGGQDYTKKYPAVVQALTDLGHDIVLDGEVTVLNKEGKPDFDALQKFNTQQGPVVYYVFDLLWMDGYNFMHLPLTERKAMLREIVRHNKVIRFSEDFEDGLTLFEYVKKIGLEGIIAKQKNSPYLQGDRSSKWYKIPVERKQEFIIGGWVESDNRPFRTLIFGAYSGDRLEWVGHAGGGFKANDMPGILKKLQALEIDESPFDTPVECDGIAHWVKPELIANIRFATFTRSGRIRKPATFLGFRDDKKASDVVREKPRVRNQKSG